MRVLITGGLGSIGRVVAQRLQEHDFELRLIDIVDEAQVQDARYNRCDIMDFAYLCEQMRGCDAVVHLAALKNPHFGPGQDVFQINTAGTFNVFEAAAQAGIRRIVQASSINAIGCGWNLGDFLPQYFPLDEDHPSTTTDPYALSKRIVEDIGAYYWRRDGIVSAALRFPGVFPATYFQHHHFQESQEKKVQFLKDFISQSEVEQQHQLAEVRALALAYRAARSMEYPLSKPKSIELNGIPEELWHTYTFDRYYLWSLLDERDAAQAIEAALTADYEGSPALFINDKHNSLRLESQMLAQLFFPQTRDWKKILKGSETLVSIDRAREIIAFEPEYPVYLMNNKETPND